jgi:N-acetylneuraminic acid mutarotase
MKIHFKQLNQFSFVFIVFLLNSFFVQLVIASSFHAVDSMSNVRAYHTATLLANGKVLIAGGISSDLDFSMPILNGTTNNSEIYDPTTQKWEKTGSLNVKRLSHTATLLTNGQVLVAGGFCNGHMLSSAELYDSATGKWTTTGSLNFRHQYHTATLLQDGRVLIAAGYSPRDGSYYPSTYAELYDTATGMWKVTAELNHERDQHTATLLDDGMVLVAGGENHNLIATFSAELYNPTTGTWSSTGNMNMARFDHTATLLPDGKVLVTGGIDASYNVISSCELYDPSNGTWTVTDSLKTARTGHCAVLLSNGQVLVTGGTRAYSAGVFGALLSSAELYDPTTGKWKSAGSMKSQRYDHTMTLLPNGKVLITGGMIFSITFGNNIVLSKTELYDPPSVK